MDNMESVALGVINEYPVKQAAFFCLVDRGD